MNKLITTDNGGFPFKLNDIRFLADGLIEAIKGLSSIYDSQTGVVILSGCERTVVGGDAVFTEGFISIDGEVYYFPGLTHLVPVGGENEYWEIEESFDLAGSKLFKDTALTHDTYLIRQATIFKSSLTQPNTRFTLSKTVLQIIREQLGLTTQSNWVDLPGAKYDTPNAALGRPQYRIDALGYYRLKGYWNGSVGVLPSPDPGIILFANLSIPSYAVGNSSVSFIDLNDANEPIIRQIRTKGLNEIGITHNGDTEIGIDLSMIPPIKAG